MLGRVMDQELRAELELRVAQAETDIDIRVSEARLAQAVNKLQRSETLQKRVFVSVEELRAHELEATTARLEVEQARLRRRIAEIERRRAEVMLQARECRQPARRRGRRGPQEPRRAGRPRASRSSASSTSTGCGSPATSTWPTTGGSRSASGSASAPSSTARTWRSSARRFEGRVVFVDSRIDPATRTARVVTEVANRDHLLASGLEARMEIIPGPAPPPPPAGDKAAATQPNQVRRAP